MKEIIRRLAVAGAAVFDALCHRRANLADHGQFDRQRLVGALHHHGTLLAGQHVGDQVGRERAEHDDVQHAHLDAVLLAHVIGDDLGVTDDGTLADDDVIGVF